MKIMRFSVNFRVQHLLNFLLDQPTAYLDEMATFLFDEFEIEPSLATISRILSEAKWSRKAVQSRAAERNEPLRTVWWGRQKKYQSHQLVFLDESAANERTGDRKFGWSPIGLICGVSRPIKRSKRWSILPALGDEGYLCHLINQGSITAEIFLEFVEFSLLPLCSAYPGPRSVLILDNATIHHNPRLRELCNERGILLEFLPPYSPDYNPIEATFKDLKVWLKRNYMLVEEAGCFEEFLEFAIGQMDGRNIKGHFREAGYMV
jgi:transposase